MTLVDIVSIASGLVAILITVAAWAHGNGKRDQMSTTFTEKLDGHERKISRLFEWQDTHEKESGQRILDIQKQFSSLETKIAVADGKSDHILEMLQGLKDQIAGIANRLDNHGGFK